jgi:hypothetical protein
MSSTLKPRALWGLALWGLALCHLCHSPLLLVLPAADITLVPVANCSSTGCSLACPPEQVTQAGCAPGVYTYQ